MTVDKLEQLARLSEKATQGEWFTGPTPGYLALGQRADGKARRQEPITLRATSHTEEIATVWNYLLPTEANAEFIAALVNWYRSGGAELARDGLRYREERIGQKAARQVGGEER
jgi:hypothetical protein